MAAAALGPRAGHHLAAAPGRRRRRTAGTLPIYLVALLVLVAAGVVAGVLWPSSRDYTSQTGTPSFLP